MDVMRERYKVCCCVVLTVITLPPCTGPSCHPAFGLSCPLLSLVVAKVATGAAKHHIWAVEGGECQQPQWQPAQAVCAADVFPGGS